MRCDTETRIYCKIHYRSKATTQFFYNNLALRGMCQHHLNMPSEALNTSHLYIQNIGAVHKLLTGSVPV